VRRQETIRQTCIDSTGVVRPSSTYFHAPISAGEIRFSKIIHKATVCPPFKNDRVEFVMELTRFENLFDSGVQFREGDRSRASIKAIREEWMIGSDEAVDGHL
jgi:hypothetical protein